jgi:hypothetical protein
MTRLRGTLLGPLVCAIVFSGCSRTNDLAPSTIGNGSNTPAIHMRGMMSKDATSGDLLYASAYNLKKVLVFTYPQGKKVGSLQGFPAPPAGLCSDAYGNVYVTTDGNGTGTNQSYVYIYQHGGTTPISILSDPGAANGCAIDPTTGNLAVANDPGSSVSGNLAVFQDAKGIPALYSDPNFAGFIWCSYDTTGDLFADSIGSGNIIDELPAKESSLQEIKLTQSINPASLQWYHRRLIIASAETTHNGDQSVYKVSISGSAGKVGRAIILSSTNGKRATSPAQFWTQANVIIGPGYGHRHESNGFLEFWNFPQGGNPTKVITPRGSPSFVGVTVSTSSSRD